MVTIVATFNGRHNIVKSKVFILLHAFQKGDKNNRDKAMTVRNISVLTGCNYHSLATMVKRWQSWRYITSFEKDGLKHYLIRTRGIHFVTDRIPPLLRSILEKDIAARLKVENNYSKGY